VVGSLSSTWKREKRFSCGRKRFDTLFHQVLAKCAPFGFYRSHKYYHWCPQVPKCCKYPRSYRQIPSTPIGCWNEARNIYISHIWSHFILPSDRCPIPQQILSKTRNPLGWKIQVCPPYFGVYPQSNNEAFLTLEAKRIFDLVQNVQLFLVNKLGSIGFEVRRADQIHKY